MYKALQATLISISDHLELAGLQNVRLSGQEIKINGDLVPPNIYLRGVIVDTHHDVEVPRFFSVEQFNDIIIKAKTTN